LLQKVTALKKSFDDGYEVHLCQETEKRVVDNTWVIYIGREEPLQRAASAYCICSNIVFHMTSDGRISRLGIAKATG
jgi:predicted nucleic acid-binding Zn finger protein